MTDGTGSCLMTLPATSCNLTSSTAGAKTLTATYSGDGGFNGTVSPGGRPHGQHRHLDARCRREHHRNKVRPEIEADIQALMP